MTDLEIYKRKLEELCPQKIRIMEVCGTHTMAIAKAGIKKLLPPNFELISGPGCPVCVTDHNEIDAMLDLSGRRDILLATYGDMMRVPGSKRGDSLFVRRAKGAAAEVVYSPVDALQLAKEHPDREIVFIGVGFETTAPGTAAAILQAAEEDIRNFSVFPMMKRVEPALRALIGSTDFLIGAFLCPGHVAAIIGEKGFEYLPKEYGLPAVISGFEPADILLSIYRIAEQIRTGEAAVYNEYKRAVAKDGNIAALAVLDKVFIHGTALWRGLGSVPGSAFIIRPEYECFDAVKKFSVRVGNRPENKACRCGEVICGKIRPEDCALFGTGCTPQDPVGPCMVSSEGACAAACKYGDYERQMTE